MCLYKLFASLHSGSVSTRASLSASQRLHVPFVVAPRKHQITVKTRSETGLNINLTPLHPPLSPNTRTTSGAAIPLGIIQLKTSPHPPSRVAAVVGVCVGGALVENTALY